MKLMSPSSKCPARHSILFRTLKSVPVRRVSVDIRPRLPPPFHAFVCCYCFMPEQGSACITLEGICTIAGQVIDITKIRDESLIISPQHMSASVPVGGATEIERVHYEDHNKEATSQPPSALEVLPSNPTPKEARSSTIVPAIPPNSSNGPTTTPRTVQHMRYNFASMASRLDREERQQTQLIDEMSNFIAKNIEREL
ncbi:hypothetical protein HAX54_001444 [Datura stramonium]|uniref:Uncharacterized protein n=1 Tax=Datura stramonium TaxID=4076 RepID=A0ABS8WSV6_DATST|nr:hypothetical protein [Datura stramonium]